MAEEVLPISSYYKVIEYIDLFRTSNWWSSVVLYQFPNRKLRRIGVYLWHKKEGKWKMKHKFAIRNRGDWLLLRESIDKLILKINAKNGVKSP